MKIVKLDNVFEGLPTIRIEHEDNVDKYVETAAMNYFLDERFGHMRQMEFCADCVHENHYPASPPSYLCGGEPELWDCDVAEFEPWRSGCVKRRMLTNIPEIADEADELRKGDFIDKCANEVLHAMSEVTGVPIEILRGDGLK